jgi:hypothetical protein
VGGPLPGIDISASAALQKMEDSEYVERMSHVNDAAGRQRHWDIFSRLLGETETPAARFRRSVCGTRHRMRLRMGNARPRRSAFRPHALARAGAMTRPPRDELP